MREDKSFDVVKYYIKRRKAFVKTIESLGYKQTRMKRDTPLIDDINDFLQTLHADLHETLRWEFNQLVECRWSAVMAFYPLLKRFLDQKRYWEKNDVSGTIVAKMELALEKAIDRIDGVNPQYIRSWLQASWMGIINRDFTETGDGEEERRLVPKLWRCQFSDSYSPNSDTLVLPDNDQPSPERQALENAAPSAKDCLKAALKDAEMIGEKMVIAEAEKLLERCREGRSVQFRKNSAALSKLKALLAANGAMEVIL